MEDVPDFKELGSVGELMMISGRGGTYRSKRGDRAAHNVVGASDLGSWRTWLGVEVEDVWFDGDGE